MLNKRITTRTITIIALCIGLNYIGGTIALWLRLPIYLDSIGTIFAGALLGPVFGVLTGITSGVLSGFTTDIFSLSDFLGICVVFTRNDPFVPHHSKAIRWHHILWFQYDRPIAAWSRNGSNDEHDPCSSWNRLS